MPEYFRLPAHGSFYRATMAGKDLKSDNGWFKLRVTITDATGNYQADFRPGILCRRRSQRCGHC